MVRGRVTSAVRRFATHSHAQHHASEAHAAAHHQAETAMLTNNGTHVWQKKGFEWSTYMGIVGGPLVLWLGLANAPDTDFEEYGRREAVKRMRSEDVVLISRQNTINGPFVFVKGEIGERPTLEE
ncbi:hypothetical protein H310_01701 [Aphanomyces invadans]|uniref:NADH dehydrogenase [ubiquinone] 1 beta subcomplex subunit 11, mitochondrial n=2 Tax=Aphanomyces invadans TaxID=157072 RepID=A0A024UTR2_9STRA|nr:hypothetical protein H310_01701 [Aphanomyces invadans]ETW09317.1 hypothetical protein H310_01701 [Aphanomyces invadans]|eukprot:XP_008863122.1 hypothetical protein H310_01701 [Aphanomyces invadans]